MDLFACTGSNSQDPTLYLNRTVVNLAHKAHQRRRVERRYLDKQPRLEAVAPERDYETVDELWRQLQLLPQRQRTAIVLRYYEDLTDHQAAEATGCLDPD